MKNYYTYYSYEEWGKGYIGSRECECLPEEDIKYFGTFSDKKFKPTKKIILQTYPSREEAIKDEVFLHNFYKVDVNPHFANRAKQTSERFYFRKTGENHPFYGRIHSKETKQKMRESLSGQNNPMFGQTNPRLGKSHSKITKKKMSEALTGENSPVIKNKWYSNGEKSCRIKGEPPPGFIPGRLLSKNTN